MGTSADMLSGSDGLCYDVVIAVEGYGNLLTTGSPAAAVTAWAGTDWSAALGGVSVRWNMRATLDPWEPFGNDASTFAFTVMDVDNSDTFGIDTHRRSGGDSSRLSVALDPNDASVVVLDSSDFDVTGTVYVGAEAIGYDDNDGATTFSDLTRGKWSPFTTDGGDRYARAHRVDSTIPGVTLAPKVTSIPTEWPGRWVAVYIHRKAGGVLDVKAQAHLAFAGRIVAIRDRADGQTEVTCEDVLKVIGDGVVFREPFRAKVSEGIFVPAGTRFGTRQRRGTTPDTTGPLDVVPSGASGADEMDEGFYTTSELYTFLNQWLAAERAATRALFSVTVHGSGNSPDGDRALMFVGDATGGSATRECLVNTTAANVAAFLGWTDNAISGTSSDQVFTVLGTEPPLRVAAIGTEEQSTFEIEGVSGSFVDQSLFVPNVLVNAAFTKGIVRIGGSYFMCDTPTSTSMTIARSPELEALRGGVAEPAVLTVDQSGSLEVQQVLVLQASFLGIVLPLLLSTGAAGFNHGTWDALPEHVGLGVPYSLFTDEFIAELSSAGFASVQRTVVVEKPTTFKDLMNASFILRHLQLKWHMGRVALTGWAVPTDAAELTLSESTKAVPVGHKDSQRTVSELSDRWTRNSIKIDIERKLFEDSYGRSITIDDKPSQNTFGSKAVTVKVRDAVVGGGILGEDVAALLPSFAAGLPFITKPALLLRFPMNVNQFETHTVGRTALLSDNFARDPVSGQRSLTGKPALIVGARYSYGGGESGVNRPGMAPPEGELEVMLFHGLSLAAYCPTAEVDSTATGGGFDAGYSSGVPSLRCLAHAHSDGADAVDASHFALDDEIRIVEIDPATAGSPMSWTRTVVSVSSNDIVLSSALSAPAWDNTKKYRVVSDNYTNTSDAQRADTYQADDGDESVANLRDAYAYVYHGVGQTSSFTNSPATNLPERHNTTMYGDGAALDTGTARAIARNLNNGIQYKWSPQTPAVYTEVADFGSPAGAATWKLACVELFHIGRGVPGPDATGTNQARRVYLAPIFKSSDGSSATARVTLGRRLPSGTGQWDITRTWPYESVSFTTSTTLTYVIPTAQSLNTSHLQLGDEPGGGTGVLYVELSEKALFIGFAELWVGPLEAA